jgi:hypothetical protein
MSELIWLTLLAMIVFLALLIPGNYLISLFWERDPSNLTHVSTQGNGTAGVTDLPSAADAQTIRGIAVVEMAKRFEVDAVQSFVMQSWTIHSSTYGTLPTFGQSQQVPTTTTAHGFEPLAAA